MSSPTVEDDDSLVSKREIKDGDDLILTLSGGGTRAALFQLGILLYLSLASRLQQIKGVVSVSGGSILAGHFLRHWPKACSDNDGFRDCAADLLIFFRTGIRDIALCRCCWNFFSGLVILNRRWSSYFLEEEYKKLFSDVTFERLARNLSVPRFAFAASEVKESERIAFASKMVYRFDLSGELVRPAIGSGGVYLASAVAASSCFPPVFNVRHLRSKYLGLIHSEFPGTLRVNDGGVTGNLGVEVLLSLQDENAMPNGVLLVCDAENSGARESSAGFLGIFSSVRTQGEAVSAATRRTVAAHGGVLLPFNRTKSAPFSLEQRTYSAVAGYRTDLDAPSWSEVYALLFHGASVCAERLNLSASQISGDAVHEAISKIVVAAGGPQELVRPTESDLANCGRRPFVKVAGNLLLAILFCLVWTGEAIHLVFPNAGYRPLVFFRDLIFEDTPIERDIEELNRQVAKAACAQEIAILKDQLVNGRRSVMRFVVGPDSSESWLYVVAEEVAPACPYPVRIKYVCEGEFPSQLTTEGTAARVVGRIQDVRLSAEGFVVTVDLVECEAEIVK